MNSIIRFVPGLLLLAVAGGCSRQPGPNSVVVQPAPGTFELCILANLTDDGEAIDRATGFFEAARTDPKLAESLRRLAEANEPPPPPTADEGSAFVVHSKDCTYRWAPVSDSLLVDLFLEPAPAPGQPGSNLYQEHKVAREKGRPHHVLRSMDLGLLSEIWWSREQPARHGWPGSVAYFVLVRVEPVEDAIRAEEVRIVWDPINAADEGHHVLRGSLDAAGAEKFAALTTRNRPSAGPPTVRSLAILIHGKVVTSPTINEPITKGEFAIQGRFTEQDATKLMAALRGE